MAAAGSNLGWGILWPGYDSLPAKWERENMDMNLGEPRRWIKGGILYAENELILLCWAPTDDPHDVGQLGWFGPDKICVQFMARDEFNKRCEGVTVIMDSNPDADLIARLEHAAANLQERVGDEHVWTAGPDGSSVIDIDELLAEAAAALRKRGAV